MWAFLELNLYSQTDKYFIKSVDIDFQNGTNIGKNSNVKHQSLLYQQYIFV